MIFNINGPEELPGIAKELLGLLNYNKVILFYGDMGAGKTTFIKAICEVLGVVSTVSSPSFSIINEYYSPTAGSLFHFDFYRLKDQEEAMDIGCEDYFYSGHYCFIEWPDKIPNLLPSRCIHISLEMAGPTQRTIVIESNY